MRRFILFVFGLILLANCVSWFALNSILTRLHAPEVFRWSVALFLLLQVAGMVGMIGMRALGYQIGTGMGRPLLSLLMIWNLLLVLPTAVASSIWALAWWLVDPGHGSTDPDGGWRIFGLVSAGLPFATAFFATAIAIWQLTQFRIRKLTLSIPNLPAALHGFTIAHLSDLHLGKLTRGKVLDEIIAATNRLNADIILFTGDLINSSMEDFPQAVTLLRRMKSRHGLFICEGNHDLMEGVLEFESAAKASGISFLFNESAVIAARGFVVRILGLRWEEPLKALPGLLAQRNPEDFAILLAHHPHVFEAVAEAGIPLTLAGHTHGGQLMLTSSIGFGPWFYRYWSGVYRRGISHLIVSNGVGNWFPLRINAPAEIIHLTLEQS